MAYGAASNQFWWINIQPTFWLAGRCQALREASLHREFLARLQHMEASTGQLVGDRLDGHYAVPLGFFTLVKFADFFAITYREVC
jgi:hypothetical protein